MIIDCVVEPVFEVRSYIISDNDHCILIDPVDIETIKQYTFNKIVDFIFLTHEHFDHVRRIDEAKNIFKAKIMCGEKAIKGLANPTINMSRYLDYLVKIIPFGNHNISCKVYCCQADETVKDEDMIIWQGHTLFFKETPGHSRGSVSLLIDSRYLFSGDTIFKDYLTATRMPGGSTKDFEKITKPWLNSLPQNIMVHSGHTKPFILLERYK